MDGKVAFENKKVVGIDMTDLQVSIIGMEAMNYLNYPLKPSSCDVPLILPQQYAVTKVMQDYLECK